MVHTVYKYSFTLLLALLVTGCASDRVDYPGDYTGQSKPQSTVSHNGKPVLPNSKPQPDTLGTLPPLFNYSAQTLTGTYAHSLAVRNFIQHMVRKHDFSETYLNGLFSRANRLDYVIRLENPPPSYGPSKPRPGSWTRYRNKFLTAMHINDGVEFWLNNADAIEKASKTYRVDPEYIVAIIGVETYFGRNIGKTCIFDALTTLAFDTYRRSQFFTSELENYLLMIREEGIEPLEPVGSWAGAMGLGQFMPSSFRRLAVDFNHDGRRDLWHEHDAIGSVAHYFSRSGWQFNNPVAYQTASVVNASTIALSTYEGDEHWRVYPNFKVIKHYNNSNKYAMAVHQLAQAIKQQYKEKQYALAQRTMP